MKAKLTLAAILSSSVIAGSLLLASVNSVQACGGMSKSAYYQQRVQQNHWLRTPLAAVIILPGIAIAAALSVGERYYKSHD